MGDSYAAKWMKVTIGVAKVAYYGGIHVVNSAGNHGGSTNGRIWTPSYDDLKGTPGIEKELDFLGDKFKNNLDGGLKELLRLLGLIIVVGAMNIDDTLCDFSGYGSRVDILAPGLDVYAMNNDGKPNKQFGASEATAIVTGLLASSISGTLYQNKQKNVKDGDTLSLEYQKKALLANGTQVAIISDGN
ncbi:hypothetical protein VKT23_013798 [Stygiomarasmius scandens]|uniref:Peptidase S8/S53 domain-containing protein n=1 Tax=Marasmiellus scandens TaxID=2682957 RepID=A0ABR1J282_9AGAR